MRINDAPWSVARDPPKARMMTLASATLAAALPHPSASLTSPSPPPFTLPLPRRPNRKWGCAARKRARRRSRATINGEVYCASMREASRPGIVLVRRVRRARRSWGEENGEGDDGGAAGLDMEGDMVTR